MAILLFRRRISGQGPRSVLPSAGAKNRREPSDGGVRFQVSIIYIKALDSKFSQGSVDFKE